ncbi:hypothetical protein [Thermocladium modestius]|uniref:hypothetical protein n=1 Tax=Thermocladium modestius TaxID=62609 RepID=UPI0009464915|nr:hypothetical protein [Thermocladium modestius]
MVNSIDHSCPNCGGPLSLNIKNNLILIGCPNCKVVVFTSKVVVMKEAQDRYGSNSFDAIMAILYDKYIHGLRRVLSRREAAGEIIKSK